MQNEIVINALHRKQIYIDFIHHCDCLYTKVLIAQLWFTKITSKTYYYLIYRLNDDSSYMKEHESHVSVSEILIYSTTVSLPFLSVVATFFVRYFSMSVNVVYPMYQKVLKTLTAIKLQAEARLV